MPLITLYLPKMGESVMEAMILAWLVQEGTKVTEGTPLLEIATDKVTAEIPATHGGIIQKQLVKKGDTVAIGAPIALLKTDQVSPLVATPPFLDRLTSSKAIAASSQTAPPSFAHFSHSLPSVKQLKLTPIARNMVRSHGIAHEVLSKLSNYTKDNWITSKVLMDYLQQPLPTGIGTSNRYVCHTSITPGDEVIPMDHVRKLIAQRMVQSKQIAPHVTSFIRADVTELVQWRSKNKANFEKKYGISLTYNPIFMTIIASVLKTFPLLNAFILDNKIIKKKNINMGFAVAMPNGNLLVPVVKKADQLHFPALAMQIDELIHKARNGTITPDALNDATYTISNIGSFHNLMGTPIIMQPQVAILALGVIERRPAVVHMEGEERIAIRNEIILSHTYDHRIIDGAIGGGFLKSLAEALHSFAGIAI